MRITLTTAAVVVGLLIPFSGMADDGLAACLQANTERSDKNTFCIGQMQQAALDAQKKALDESFSQSTAALAKQQKELAQKQDANRPAPASPSVSASNSPPASSASTPTPEQTGTSNTTSPSNTSSGHSQSTTPATTPSTTTDNSAKAPTPSTTTNPLSQSPPGFPKKPAGVQWY